MPQIDKFPQKWAFGLCPYYWSQKLHILLLEIWPHLRILDVQITMITASGVPIIREIIIFDFAI